MLWMVGRSPLSCVVRRLRDHALNVRVLSHKRVGAVLLDLTCVEVEAVLWVVGATRLLLSFETAKSVLLS